jgi:uncharacterized membrane protein
LVSRLNRIERRWLLLLLTMALGSVLRIANASYSYNGDEFLILRAVSGTLVETLQWAADVAYFPLHVGLLHFWIRLVGNSEIATRMLSVLFSVMAIPALYGITNFLFERRVALVSAFILAISPFHIEQAQQLKPYALLALLSLLSAYFALKWMDEPNRKGYWLGYILASVLGMYSHPFFAYTVLALCVYFLVRWWERGNCGDVTAWVLAQGLTVLLFTPWLLVWLNQLHYVAKLAPAMSPLTAPVELALTFTLGYSAFSLTQITISKVPILADVLANLPLLIFSGATFATATLGGFVLAVREGPKGYFPVILLAVPVGVSYLVALTPQFNPWAAKYLISSSIGLYILLAVAVIRLLPRWFGVLLGIILLSLNIYSLNNFYFHDRKFGRRENFRGLVEYVVANHRQGDLIVSGSGAQGVQYYIENRTSGITPVYMSPWGNTPVQTILNDFVPSAQRVWLVCRVREDSYPNGPWIQFQNRLKQLYKLEQRERFNPALVLYLYERTVP